MSEERMDQWTSKVADKLKEYQYSKGANDTKVESFFDKMDSKEEAAKKSNFRWVRLAASVALLIAAGVAIYSVNSVEKSTGSDLATLTLPDGSSVEIRPNSSVSFNRIGWLFSRNVNLEGEAYFEVEKGSKFTVKSDIGSTSVLGTKFTVKARGAKYEVSCFEGKVSVAGFGKSKILTPGQGVVLEKPRLQDIQLPSSEPVWKAQELTFDETPLSVVLSNLESVYSLDIQGIDEIEDEVYTGFFPTDDLDLALRLICEPMDLSYKKESGNIIRVSKKKNAKKKEK